MTRLKIIIHSILLLNLVLLSLSENEPKTYDVVHVNPKTTEQRKHVADVFSKHNVDVLSDGHVAVHGNEDTQSRFKRDLDEGGIRHTVVKRQISLFNRDAPIEAGDFSESDSIHDFQRSKYHHHQDMMNMLRAAARENPHMTELFTIGKSAQRRDILGIKIQAPTKNVKSKVWIDAGVHAREWIAPATAMYLIWALLTRSHDPRIADLLTQTEFIIVPNANPDGYEYSWTEGNRYWRKNRAGQYCAWTSLNRADCCGVDLNRNFPFKFGVSGASSNPCEDIYKGPQSLSEKESKQYADYVLTIKDELSAFLTLHSFGQTLLVPYGYAMDAYPDDYNETLRVGVAMAEAMTQPYNAKYKAQHSASLYPAGGGSDDWAKSLGIPYVYTVELRSNPEPVTMDGFVVPAEDIPKSGVELLAGIDRMLQVMHHLHKERL